MKAGEGVKGHKEDERQGYSNSGRLDGVNRAEKATLVKECKGKAA